MLEQTGNIHVRLCIAVRRLSCLFQQVVEEQAERVVALGVSSVAAYGVCQSFGTQGWFIHRGLV